MGENNHSNMSVNSMSAEKISLLRYEDSTCELETLMPKMQMKATGPF